MRILFFSKSHDVIFNFLNNEFFNIKNLEMVLLQDYKSFEKEFFKCFSGETIIVFCAETEKDIEYLEKQKKDFFDIKLVINLSDNLKKFQKRIFLLNPRFVICSDFSDIFLMESVRGLVKIIQSKKQQK